MWTYFKIWPLKSILRKLKSNESLTMVSLQIYQEKLSVATFIQVHSNIKEVSYIPWQNNYPNLKTTCHIKPKFFLCPRLLKKFLLAKYFIPVTMAISKIKYEIIKFNNNFCLYWNDFVTTSINKVKTIYNII